MTLNITGALAAPFANSGTPACTASGAFYLCTCNLAESGGVA